MTKMKLNKDWHIETIRSFDGTPIRFGIFSQGDFKSTLVFLNGRTEWIEKYQDMPKELKLPKNVQFLTLDHRGQGASGGKRADIPSYEIFAKDALHVINQACDHKPYSILGHSMGGLISIYGALCGIFDPTKLALTSPLLGLRQSFPRSIIGKNLLKLVESTKISQLSTQIPLTNEAASQFTNNPYTSDLNRFEKINNAPFVVPPPSLRWVSATQTAIDYTNQLENIKKLKCPVLLLSASDERIVNPISIIDWAKKAELADVQHEIKQVTIENARHELLNESLTYRSQAYLLIRNWLSVEWQL